MDEEKLMGVPIGIGIDKIGPGTERATADIMDAKTVWSRPWGRADSRRRTRQEPPEDFHLVQPFFAAGTRRFGARLSSRRSQIQNRGCHLERSREAGLASTRNNLPTRLRPRQMQPRSPDQR